MAKKKNNLEKWACILLIIGGLNYGVGGFFNYDVINMLGATLEMVVKALIGLAALYGLWGMFQK